MLGVSRTPELRSTALPGAQIPPPERAVEPPYSSAFSSTMAVRPSCAAVSAAVIPAAPLPTTTMSALLASTPAGSVVMPPPGPHTRTRCSFAEGNAVPETRETGPFDGVVVGFGAAGACAALEAAAAGRSVVVLDRFAGGGATALSGGVVYAGGGTPQQRAAGVSDTAEAMLAYLST